MKQIIQRNLPLTDVYKVHSFAYVPLIDGGGTCCENCGKLISNIVTLENQYDKKFVVGNDCADTLTIDKSKMMLDVQPAFAEGKAIRAKLLKHFKSGAITGAYIYTCTEGKQYLVMKINRGGTSMQIINHPAITLPYISNILINK